MPGSPGQAVAGRARPPGLCLPHGLPPCAAGGRRGSRCCVTSTPDTWPPLTGPTCCLHGQVRGRPPGWQDCAPHARSSLCGDPTVGRAPAPAAAGTREPGSRAAPAAGLTRQRRAPGGAGPHPAAPAGPAHAEPGRTQSAHPALTAGLHGLRSRSTHEHPGLATAWGTHAPGGPRLGGGRQVHGHYQEGASVTSTLWNPECQLEPVGVSMS